MNLHQKDQESQEDQWLNEQSLTRMTEDVDKEGWERAAWVVDVFKPDKNTVKTDIDGLIQSQRKRRTEKIK